MNYKKQMNSSQPDNAMNEYDGKSFQLGGGETAKS